MQRRMRVTLAIAAATGAVLAGAGTAFADDLGGLGGLLGGDDNSSSSRYDSGGYGSNYRGSNYRDSDSSDYNGDSDSRSSRGSSSYGSDSSDSRGSGSSNDR